MKSDFIKVSLTTKPNILAIIKMTPLALWVMFIKNYFVKNSHHDIEPVLSVLEQ